MRFCDNDEVKILSTSKDNLFFGTIENVSSFLKKKGRVLETDFSKRKDMYTYFVEFDKDKEKRWWFLETELYLV
jgi:hypothetical protein